MARPLLAFGTTSEKKFLAVCTQQTAFLLFLFFRSLRGVCDAAPLSGASAALAMTEIRNYILSISANTPPAVTSAPAPGPCTTKGLSLYRLV